MNKFNLSSSIKGFNGAKLAPEWYEIESLLMKFECLNGSIVLSVIDGPEIGPESLEVRAENRTYLVTLLDNITEDDDIVRTFTNTDVKQNEPSVEILGDYWSPNMLTCDLSLVVEIFREFYETGNVNNKILSA